MTEVMVSIRMPRSLLQELKDIAQEEHFLDLSELVRSVTRKKWMQHTRPELYELQKLRTGIEAEIKRKGTLQIQRQVNKELEKIKSKLKGSDFFE